MTRIVLLYGLSGGLLIATLQVIEYRFLVLTHAVEIYGAIVAAVFAAVGIRLGQMISRPEVARDGPAPQPFARDEARVAELGITRREMEILEQIAAGRSTREIAGALFVSENTVKTHAARIFDKLSVRRRTQAVHEARRLGIIP